DAATGLLTNKVYADGSRIRYTYTEGGRLATRVWARGVTTAYSYNTLGQLISVNYSDATPGIVLGYDRMGNTASAADASGTRVFTHDPDGQMLSDTLSALGQTFALLESYDTFGRNTGYALSNTVGGVSSLIAETEQGYDAFGRISEVSVSGIPAPFHYDWLPGSELQQSLVMPNGVTRETAYEPNRDLPVSVTHTNSSGAVLTRRTFTRDAVGHLTGRTRYRLGDATNRLDVFSQNTRGELVCAALGTNSYAYAFDNIGNRLTTEEPGLSAVYFANGLNQYTRISNSVPSCEFISAFDADGNQTLIRTATGIWNVTYNAENRPVCFSNDTAVIEMAYDYMGRRFEYKETASGAVARHECYLYRGYLQVAALDLLDGTNALHAIAWDPTEPVATRPLALQTKSGWFAYGFDQVKNVTELFDSVGDIVAAYDYAPFGAVTTSSGSAVAVNPITFSSEIDDATLGLIHYTFRPLNTLEGRWFGPDPIGDLSFRKKYSQRTQVQNEHHLYLFCANSALETIDPDGAMAQPLIDRRHPPKGKRLIVVPQNTILIVYGHHFQNPKHSRHGKGLENIWNIVASTDNDKGCAYAAVVTCMAGAVPNEIPLPGYSPIASNIELPINDFSADTDMGRELGKVKKAADKEAKEMCKRCCVKKIHVEVDSYGLKLSEYLRYPTLKSWDVPCK
ncbi:MAG: RHS repeat-associated core domain-containing protein, partial [Kiritimatiellia bacterium]